MSRENDRFETRPLGPIGVEILGLDLRQPVDDATWSELRATVVSAGIVLLRRQELQPLEQLALGERFGPLERIDLNPDDPAPAVAVIGNVDPDGQIMPADHPHMKLISINEGWHTDSSFREIPASFSLFSCVVAPEEGGATDFVSLERAWEALNEDERESLIGRAGIHDYPAAYRKWGNLEGGAIGYDLPALPHPLARLHPESRNPILYVSEHVNGIEGLSDEASRPKLDRLISVATDPAYVLRLDWSPGDLAIWDNRSMLHRAEGFDERYARVMHHVRVAGFEAPIALSRD